MLADAIFNNPVKLKRCTGLTTERFNMLAARIDPRWQEAERKRLFRPNRKRDVGAGHPYTLDTTKKKLAAVLLWYRVYGAFWLIGMMVGIDAGNMCRLVSRIRPLIEDAADPSLSTYLKDVHKRRKKITSIEELVRQFPDIADIFIDVTEQPVQRKKRVQKRYYSGKKKRHTVKTQVAASKRGRILHLGKKYPGHWHDYTIFKREDILRLLPPDIRKWLDSGYDGILKQYPDHAASIKIPIKRRRNKKILTRREKRHNRAVSRVRIGVEHVISYLKKYQILSQVYRNALSNYEQDMRNVAALVNFRHGFA